MNDNELARLFRAIYGSEKGPDKETRTTAFRRLVFSEDGLTLIKHFSPCLRTHVNASVGVSGEYMEGRRSVILELIKTATNEGEEDGR